MRGGRRKKGNLGKIAISSSGAPSALGLVAVTLTLSSARPRERPSWRLRRPVLAAVGSHRPTEPTARRPERSVEPSAVHEAGCERECQPTLSCDTRSLRRFSRAETALLDRADRARHRQQGARDDKSDKAACQAERLFEAPLKVSLCPRPQPADARSSAQDHAQSCSGGLRRTPGPLSRLRAYEGARRRPRRPLCGPPVAWPGRPCSAGRRRVRRVHRLSRRM